VRGKHKPPDPVRVEFSGPLKLGADAPLSVRLESPPSRPLNRWEMAGRYSLFFVVILVFALSLFFAGFFAYPTQAPPPEALPGLFPSLSVSYAAPKYLAVNDEAILEISALNILTQPVTVTVALVFADASLPVVALDGGPLAVTFENLRPGVRATRALRLALRARPAGRQLDFTLRALWPDGTTQDTTQAHAFGVTPLIPYLRAGLNWVLSVSGFLTFLCTLLWDRFLKRLLFPE
jgi:hypothetical protein